MDLETLVDLNLKIAVKKKETKVKAKPRFKIMVDMIVLKGN